MWKKTEKNPERSPGCIWTKGLGQGGKPAAPRTGGAHSLTVLAGEQEGDLHDPIILGPLVAGSRQQPEGTLRREGSSGTQATQASCPQGCHTSGPKRSKDVRGRPQVREGGRPLEMG